MAEQEIELAYTPRAASAISVAARHAKVMQSSVTPPCLLYGIATDSSSVAGAALVEAGVTPGMIAVHIPPGNVETGDGQFPPDSAEVRSIYRQAERIAARRKDRKVGPEHLLLSICKMNDNDGYRLLTSLGNVSVERIADRVREFLGSPDVAPDTPEPVETVAADSSLILHCARIQAAARIVAGAISATNPLTIFNRESTELIKAAMEVIQSEFDDMLGRDA